MLNFLMTFIWRRKLIFLTCALILLIGIWIWALFYTAYTYNENDNKPRNFSIKDFDAEHKAILAKFGLQITDTNGVRFVKPTMGKSSSTLRYRESEKMLQYVENTFRGGTEIDGQIIKHHQLKENDKNKHYNNNNNNNIEAAEIQSHYEHELQRMNIPIVAGIGPGDCRVPTQRLVHFDLKGAPLKISYMKRLLPIIKTLGATGILIEYEDMFPYTGSIQNVTAQNAYKINEIRELLHAAGALGLSVMPLIQTFGHMEFILKLNEYKDLREVFESPQSICPSNNDSMIFIEEMIKQIIELHSMHELTIPLMDTSSSAFSFSSSSSSSFPIPSGIVGLEKKFNRNAPKLEKEVEKEEHQRQQQQQQQQQLLAPQFTHIHIGCDEVYRMGECPKCKKRVRDELFLAHVKAVAQLIKRRWPHLKIVIWDDMLRHIQLFDLQESDIGRYVEPMIWVYAEDIYRFVTTQIWEKYAMVFPTVWTASAFKGAHGETLLIPPLHRHLENNLKWLAIIKSESNRFTHGIQGIALTGWQRYDHFAVLCELLPTAIPSLAVCLSTMSNGYFEINAHENPTLSTLTCPEPTRLNLHKPWIELNHDQELNLFSKCMFPGSTLYRFVLRLSSIQQEINQYLDCTRRKRGWMTDYNIHYNFSSPLRVQDMISDVNRYLITLNALSKNAEEAMVEIYDKWTIMEFIEQHITPLIAELNRLELNAKSLMSVSVWPRRPLPYNYTEKSTTRDMDKNLFLQTNKLSTENNSRAH